MPDNTEKMLVGSATLPEEGEVFADRYEIIGQAGRGGFAKIFRALDTTTQQTVALKVLVPQMPAPNYYSDELRSRFHREALVLGEVSSPYIVSLLNFGQADSGLLFMAFEYVAGKTLGEVLDLGPVPFIAVEHIVPQLLDALQNVHAAGLIHRDLKPSNIMVYEYEGDPNHVKLLDFGIAKSYAPLLSTTEIPDVTKKGQVVGTPRYMSPEQILDKPCTPASDLYSLACVVVEMVSGERLVPGDDAVSVVRRHLDAAPLVIPADLPLPVTWRAILARMLNKSQADRPQSAAEVGQVIEKTLVDIERPSITAPLYVKDLPALQRDISSAQTRPQQLTDLIQSTSPTVQSGLNPLGVPPDAAALDRTIPSDRGALGPRPDPAGLSPTVLRPELAAFPPDGGVETSKIGSARLSVGADELEAVFPTQATSVNYTAVAIAGALNLLAVAFFPWWMACISVLVIVFVVFRAFAQPTLLMRGDGWLCADRLGPIALKRSGELSDFIGLSVRPLESDRSEVVMMRSGNKELFLARLETSSAMLLAERVNAWAAAHR